MKILRNIFFVLALLALVSCDKVKKYPWNDAWNNVETPVDPESPDKPTDPETPTDPENPTDPETPTDPEKPTEPEKPIERVGKARMVWIDAAANFKDYANSKSTIESDMQRLKDVGFTGVIVDVRPTNTGVLFKSSIEDALTKVDAWVGGRYQWVNRTENFDYLQAFIDAGKKVGIEVYASINTMVGGCYCGYGLGPAGYIYKDSAKKSWVSVVNTKQGLKQATEVDNFSTAKLEELGMGQYRGTGARFVNPANDEVVDYLLTLLGELAAYDVAGIILDRCRYDDNDLMSDFSDVSRTKFEAFYGKKVENWPGDIFGPGVNTLTGNGTDIQKKWMEFRAKTIHDFIEKASTKVHQVRPKIRFGAYVGGWYSSYYNSGVNWASPKYETSTYYKWASADYNEYGYADHCDIMIIGAYAGTQSIFGTSEWTMQGFCKRAETLFAGDVPFVGGPDIGNSTGFTSGGQGALMPSIVEACINASTEGMFFFDLCHIKMFNYWDDIKKAFDQYLEKYNKQ